MPARTDPTVSDPPTTWSERLRDRFLRPAAPHDEATAESPSATELAAEISSATDKERIIGLLAAPWAAAIGILIASALISHDPPAVTATGALNHLHTPVSDYYEVLGALVALSVVMLVAAWFRKRVVIGIASALYGLTVFNLHYWGFGVPFLACGAWLLVRAYRLQRSLKEATGESASPRAGRTTLAAARPNKRYTPPTARSRA
jgi:hypothetical protein